MLDISYVAVGSILNDSHLCMIGLTRYDFLKLESDLIIGVVALYIGIPNSRCSLSRLVKNYPSSNDVLSYNYSLLGSPRPSSIFSLQRYLWSSFIWVTRPVFTRWFYIARPTRILCIFHGEVTFGLQYVIYDLRKVFFLFLRWTNPWYGCDLHPP